MLLDDHGGHAFAHDADEGGEEFVDDDRGEAFGGLVEQEETGVEDQGAGDGEHLLLAAGELVAHVAAAFLEAGEHGVGGLDGPGAGAGDGGEVLLDGEGAEDVALLRDPADAGGGAALGAERGEVGAGEADGAAEAAGDAGDGVDEGGLADAVAAEDGEGFSLCEAERDAVEDGGSAVAGA